MGNDLHAIVLNWNLPYDTLACVASLRQGRGSESAVTVVDNGSTDDCLRLLREGLGQDVELLETGRNLGFAAGMNVGIEHALARGARSVLLLNNDTIVTPGMPDRLQRALEGLPRAGIVAPAIYRYDQRDTLWRLGDRESRWLPLTRPVHSRALSGSAGRCFQVDYVTGCAMLVGRSVFESVGLFDPAYYMYFEDADFCQRARKAGFEVWVAPQARMWHKVAASAALVRPTVRYAESWGRARFYRRHRPGRAHWLAPAYLVVRTLKTVAHDLRAGAPALARPALQGLLDGYLGRSPQHASFRQEWSDGQVLRG